MKLAFTYHGHTLIAEKNPHGPLLDNQFHADGVRLSCTTCSLPYVICLGVVFAVNYRIDSLIIDGVELKSTKMPKYDFDS